MLNQDVRLWFGDESFANAQDDIHSLQGELAFLLLQRWNPSLRLRMTNIRENLRRKVMFRGTRNPSLTLRMTKYTNRSRSQIGSLVRFVGTNPLLTLRMTINVCLGRQTCDILVDWRNCPPRPTGDHEGHKIQQIGKGKKKKGLQLSIERGYSFL